MPDEITDIDLTTVRQYMDDDDAWEALSKQGACVYTVYECTVYNLIDT